LEIFQKKCRSRFYYCAPSFKEGKMYLSKHKNGYYYVYFNDIYTKRRRSITTKSKLKTDAIKFLSRFETDVRQRIESRVEIIQLREFVNKYLLFSASRHTYKTSKSYKTTFNMLEEHFGNVQLTDLSPIKMKNFIQYRIKSGSLYAARKDLINLSSAFKKAVEDNYLLINPCNDIRRIKLPEKQPNFFSKEDFKKLLETIDDKPFKFLVEIAINTGLRQMELITLQWDQVDFKDRLITLNNRNHITKGKKLRSIPLNLKALQILSELELSRTNELVFTRDGNKLTQDYVSKKFKKYIKETKINPQLNFHSLRHTFASWLVQRGVGIYQVSKLLGHVDIKTTQIYAHVRAEDLRESINVLND
jgi:integrase